jgi:hypothetical protein
MDPTLDEIQREEPNVDTVHFFSDGPSVHVQYRFVFLLPFYIHSKLNTNVQRNEVELTNRVFLK